MIVGDGFEVVFCAGGFIDNEYKENIWSITLPELDLGFIACVNMSIEESGIILKA